MRIGGERNFLQDHVAPFEVRERKRTDQQGKLGGRKPGKGLQAAQMVEVGGTISFGFIQNCTIRMMY